MNQPVNDSELSAWRDLVQSAGWARLKQHVAAEWGLEDANGAAFRTAVRAVADDPNDAAMAMKLRQVLAAQSAVQKLIRLPDDKIAQLKHHDDPLAAHMGRRGAL